FTGLQWVGISTARQSGRSRCWSIDNSLEEERDWHTQNLAEFIQTAGADTIFALFIFVHLLKRKAQGCRHLCLTYSQQDPLLSHTRCDMQIDRPTSFAAPSQQCDPLSMRAYRIDSTKPIDRAGR